MNNAIDVLKTDRARQLFGCLTVFCSAFFFYMATVVIRWAGLQVDVPASYFVFARFLAGFVTVFLVMVVSRQRFRPKKHHLLIGRTVANCVAVFCFFKAVEVTSVAEANILNMTYPLFIALFTWFFLKGQRDRVAMLMVLIAFSGVWLILSPGDIGLNRNNLWGLASGFSAAFAIIYLNVSRQYHDSNTILIYMFGLGAALIYAVFHEYIFWPNRLEAFYLGACAAFGICGQYLLTTGFRYVTAVEGSIISSSRILLAALLGPWLAMDAHLGITGWIGALLIFSANVYLTVRK